MEYKIMLIEDDASLAQLLSSHLDKYGYKPLLINDFENILNIFIETNPHLILIDINLPKYDGFYWCRKIRQISTIPIIFISARDSEMDQVMGIESGADDYITKPFYYDVVIAKIKSQLRRCYGEFAPDVLEERKIELEGLTLYPERPELHFSGNSIVLTKKEAVLAELLIRMSPRAVSRDMILEKLWDDQAFIDENTLNVNVARLRKKLQQIGIGDALETVRGYGYRLNVTWRKKG
ncbi:response regulator transcription factor [Calidifontibacillus erzurumensis]|uniref:Response regulator transcription factor n=1 Tax=Calidifontibacillus erzurumensis TaxID=2741433 RepID=A0A8J8GI68_9BACI|nr:response regulator transcription factor [Calidifontibacillus erzurumensis]NSL52213.1 response regulator transcription factor [Calidifontibacillus erzurumensis]